MDSEFSHNPVLVDDVVALFEPVPPGVLVDGTIGGGGHAAALLEAHPHLRVLGLDRDPAAVAAASDRLAPFGARAQVVRARFDHMGELLVGLGEGSASGVLLDLGVSSPQFDRPERGFSYRYDSPLDMRMDPSSPTTAADIVNRSSEDHLARLLAANGEGRFARRLARAIVAGRPITTTGQLTDVIRKALPAAVVRQAGHPARKVFQALRIAVNDELNVLSATLPSALDLLAPGARMVVIAYHSGEDRLVKAAFAAAATGGCRCPAGLPCACGAVSLGRLVFRGARRARPAEVEGNRRSESARLRAFERSHHMADEDEED